MEKELTKNESEGIDLEINSGQSSGDRHEITEKSDLFPQKKETNTITNDDDSAESSTIAEGEGDPEERLALEGRVAELEQRLEEAEGLRREGEKTLTVTQKSLKEAVSRYRTLLLQSTPEAPESMVVGETVDEVDRSFAEAKALVQQVRRDVEEKMSKERLPTGSPARGAADFSSLTAMEKIRSALSR